MEKDKATIQQAARRLGISEGAVRKKVKRGTLDHIKGEDGRIYIYLPPLDTRVDDGVGSGVDEDKNARIDEMASRIESLERQLEEANTRDRENRRIIAGLVQRVPELEAADFPTESDAGDYESYEEPPQHDERPDEGYDPTEETAEPQTASQRPWWKRIFGG